MGVPIELVIFDCDGVLVDSERIGMLVLERVGMPMSEADVIDRFVGRSPAVMHAAVERHLAQPLSPILQQEFAGLYERFAGRIFSATEVQRGKPAPDLFIHSAERMSTPPEACLVIEDSQYGVQAARAAGMEVLAYDSGLVDPRLLVGERTVVFSDMRALPRMVSERASERCALGY